MNSTLRPEKVFSPSDGKLGPHTLSATSLEEEV